MRNPLKSIVSDMKKKAGDGNRRNRQKKSAVKSRVSRLLTSRGIRRGIHFRLRKA